MSDQRVRAEVTPLNERFFEAAGRGELSLQRCDSCSAWRYPPSSICSSCLSTEYRWLPVSGTGTVFSWVVMHRRYLVGFDDLIPYTVGLIRLDEGPMLLTRIVGDAALIDCDARVEVTFEELSPEISVPVFHICDESDQR